MQLPAIVNVEVLLCFSSSIQRHTYPGLFLHERLGLICSQFKWYKLFPISCIDSQLYQFIIKCIKVFFFTKKGFQKRYIEEFSS